MNDYVSFQVFWAVGSIFAVGVALPTVNTIGWRWYLIFITIPLFIFLALSKVFISFSSENYPSFCLLLHPNE